MLQTSLSKQGVMLLPSTAMPVVHRDAPPTINLGTNTKTVLVPAPANRVQNYAFRVQ
jgi:hypothetical protein